MKRESHRTAKRTWVLGRGSLLVAVFLLSVSGTARASQASRPSGAFRVYLPSWLPPEFRVIRDPLKSQYPETNARHFLRRYGVQGRWVDFLEGKVGCCLDGAGEKRAKAIILWSGRHSYLLRNEKQFGGDILWWDQGKTYVAINSPNLSPRTLIHIARFTRATGTFHQ